MILFWNKKLEDRIKNKTITTKQFIIYSIFVIGSFSSLLRTTRYPVITEAYDIAYWLSFIPIIILIIQFIHCYKIIKGKDINLFLYAIIPLTFTLRFMYIFVLMIPLLLLNTFIIRTFNLDFNFWNVINVQIITIIMNIFFSVHFVKIIKRIYKDNIDILD